MPTRWFPMMTGQDRGGELGKRGNYKWDFLCFEGGRGVITFNLTTLRYVVVLQCLLDDNTRGQRCVIIIALKLIIIFIIASRPPTYIYIALVLFVY